ncbi:MAG: hypothetical protein WDO13_00290 [Verrucomicrobiota bacterium]
MQRQLSSSERLIIPIWHGIDRATVLSYSPSLADVVAIPSSKGLRKIVEELLGIFFPEEINAPYRQKCPNKARI